MADTINFLKKNMQSSIHYSFKIASSFSIIAWRPTKRQASAL